MKSRNRGPKLRQGQTLCLAIGRVRAQSLDAKAKRSAKGFCRKLSSLNFASEVNSKAVVRSVGIVAVTDSLNTFGAAEEARRPIHLCGIISFSGG